MASFPPWASGALVAEFLVLRLVFYGGLEPAYLHLTHLTLLLTSRSVAEICASVPFSVLGVLGTGIYFYRDKTGKCIIPWTI